MFKVIIELYDLFIKHVVLLFTVTVFLQISGSAHAQSPLIAPPANIWTTSQTQTSISVAWTPVADKRLQSYNLRLNGKYAGWTQPGVNAFTFNNLQSGTDYNLGVLSVEVPAKVYSDYISVIASTLGDLIEQPDDVWIAGSTPDSVTIGWSAVEDARLQSYNLALNGVYAGWTLPGTTEFTFDGLIPGMEHTFGVRSVEVPAEIYSPLTTITFTHESNACSSPEKFQTASVNGTLHGFVDANGIPNTLNGINVRAAENSISTNYSEAEFNTMVAKGFDHIRLPLHWHQFEISEGVFDTGRLDALNEVIRNAENVGLNVILDPIHLKNDKSANYWGVPAWAWGTVNPTLNDVFDELNDHALPYLKWITTRFCDDPNVIAIDLVNEPREPQRGSYSDRNHELISMYADWITELRAIDPNKTFLVEPFYGGGSIDGSALASLSQFGNIVWSFHDYYAGEGSPSNGFSNWGLASISPRTETHDSVSSYPKTDDVKARADMAEHAQVHISAAALAEIPVHIGEYGIPRGWTGRSDFLCDKTKVYNELDIPRTAWVWNQDVDGNFGMWHPNSGWVHWVDAIFDFECQ